MDRQRPEAMTPRDPQVDRPAIRPIAGLLGIGAGYFVLAKFGLTLASIHPSATPIWPASGFAFAAMLLWGYRICPAIFLASLLANATTAGSIYTSLGIATGNCLEALIGVYLVRLWSSPADPFETPAGVAKFSLIALLPGAMLSATTGVATLSLAGYADWRNFDAVWLTWWLGDVAGILVVAPVILLWARRPASSRPREPSWEPAWVLATALAVGLLAFSPLVAALPVSRGALAFSAILPLMWAALRLGRRDTATVALLLSGLAVWGTVAGHGPFAQADLNDSFLLLVTFMIGTAVPSLALSAEVGVRNRAEDDLRRAHDLLEQRVQQRTAQLNAVSRQLLETQETQSRHLARELHDEIGQILAVMRLNLLAVSEARPVVAGGRKLTESIELIDDILTKIRSIALELRPAVLDDLGLWEALHWLAEHHARHAGFFARVEGSASVQEIREPVTTACFRIAQPALTNAARHAGARNVRIRLAAAFDALTLTVEDDGRGFDLAAAWAGAAKGRCFGLLSMQERAALVGGVLEIDSAIGQGTRVIARIPLPRGSGDSAG